MITDPLLTVADVSVAFHQYVGLLRRRHVVQLDNVSMEMAAGEILAVVGESGAGKSLLADVILGLLPPNAHVSGEVRFHGRELVDADRKGRVRYVPQGTGHIDPTMKIGDFIALSGTDPVAQLARFGLGPGIAMRFPHELSGGMLRRVSLAASVSDDMELLIADEPTPGLHPEAVAEVTDHFRQVRAEGASILFITHDMLTAASVADRIAVMRGGTIDTVAAGVDELSGYAHRLWRAQPAHDFWEALS
ncbi:ATP-binding cassette domain-containing protein [Corynebacterium guangdongense]|uniref:Nickel import system ATP-binding protein NikD n=1 Tax=Corynebacterium guangdongense TaxID=1783348 RepID=A0ABU1ZZD5_9CORY|nr:ATP-binding cassette domain-containing protein [Corynebacterium guangdongense]MDR7330285.1 peptide/nickel transport system ATP-binding protein [Corynebacterium guangdongense]WJZ18843.1 Oligopeptide transport ATP-binding protein OppD [Corynebacterium guangdongense]